MNHTLLPPATRLPQHAVTILGAPKEVTGALAVALRQSCGYTPGDAADRPVVCVIVDATDVDPGDVVVTYIEHALQAARIPIPLFLTHRAERFANRGLAWDPEFLVRSTTQRLPRLAAHIRMLAQMWGAHFPLDVVRDAVVGRFRQRMQLDAHDYHDRSIVVEDLQRCADWDGSLPPPPIRVASSGHWRPGLKPEHAFARLFASTYKQIEIDFAELIAVRNRGENDSRTVARVHDLANTILCKIPRTSGRLVHALGDAKPYVLVIDDEAPKITPMLQKSRIGFESDAATLGDTFHIVPEQIDLGGLDLAPSEIDERIRQWVTGARRPGDLLPDLRCADLILLDLSLNQSRDSELAGFVLLEKFRRNVPDIPIVIHTGSAALGHIIQAIRDGADWYVRKDAARAYSEFASVLEDITRRPEWRKRASRLEQERTIVGKTSPELETPECLYILRSLAEREPEGKLALHLFSSGLSGAITCGVHIVPRQGEDDAAAQQYPISSFVAKIDRPYVMVSERERFRRLVRPHIANRTGRIDSDVVHAGPDIAGIAYSFSGLQQGRRTDDLLQLQPFGEFLDRYLDRPGASFATVSTVFHDLLHDLLQSLHRGVPTGTREHWMEPLFDECESLRDAHELRLPPRIEIELHALGDPRFEPFRDISAYAEGASIELPLCRVQKTGDTGILVLLRDDATGYVHRAQLTGEIAAFVAGYRTLRPNRPLSVRGVVTRLRASQYDPIRDEFAADLQWLAADADLDPFDAIEEVLQTFDDIPEVIGTVHGDLNLNNILIDVEPPELPVRGALWLIDFARTRRDSIAHDFAELEVDLATRLLSATTPGLEPADAFALFRSLDAGPLYERTRYDVRTAFVTEACQYVRRAAAAAGVRRREYLATVFMYHLIVLKLHRGTTDGRRRTDLAYSRRRWSLFGAAAALTELRAATDAATPRIPVRHRGSEETRRTRGTASAHLPPA
jgi:CheY-like chemotaxis protein